MIVQDEYVYIDNPDDENHGRIGKVTGLRPVAGLLRVDFTGKGNDYAVPFQRTEVAEVPDITTHHLIPVPVVGGTPTCRYCEKTVTEINAETDRTEATRKPCPVAVSLALGSRIVIRA